MSGIAVPVGQTVTKLVAVTWVAVTFSTTAVAVDGTTPRPVTCSVTGLPGPTGCSGRSSAVASVEQTGRVGPCGPSNRRCPIEVPEHVGDEVDRVALGTKLTIPPSPTLQITRLGTVSPAPKLTFDVCGIASPAGPTDKNPSDSVGRR